MSASNVSILGIMDRFPDEEAAMRWLESAVWAAQRCLWRLRGSADIRRTAFVS